MIQRSYDTIVLGLGAMGSSAAYHLASRGKKVLGLEQFGCAHDKGSSYGKSRLIRQAYFEHPDYVPLLKRSYELWEKLSRATRRSLLHKTGVVIYGPQNGGSVLPGVRRSSRDYQIPIEELSSVQAKKRFPLLNVPEGFEAIFEPGAGFLEVENCILSYCEEATKSGADLHFNEGILSWKSQGGSVNVRTEKAEYTAEKLVVTLGAWSGQYLGDLGMSLKVQRVPLFWFDANESYSEQAGFPCFAYDLPYGFIYGFPWEKGQGIKIAPHIPGDTVENPSRLDRTPTFKELAPVVRCLEECLPGVGTQVLSHAMCMYTMSFDSHFIIDLHPHFKNVALACGFSGHGFKFSSVIGEVLADLTIDGKTPLPVSFLKVRPS